jgi:hypothetical protein
MSTKEATDSSAARVLDRDEVEGVLSGALYTPTPTSETRLKTTPRRDEKPQHYKVICISMYTKDLARLDEVVEQIKGRGITKANRSALIRVALEQLDLDNLETSGAGDAIGNFVYLIYQGLFHGNQ